MKRRDNLKYMYLTIYVPHSAHCLRGSPLCQSVRQSVTQYNGMQCNVMWLFEICYLFHVYQSAVFTTSAMILDIRNEMSTVRNATVTAQHSMNMNMNECNAWMTLFLKIISISPPPPCFEESTQSIIHYSLFTAKLMIMFWTVQLFTQMLDHYTIHNTQYTMHDLIY